MSEEEGRVRGTCAALLHFREEASGLPASQCGRLELQRRSLRKDLTTRSLQGMGGRVPSMLFDIEMESNEPTDAHAEGGPVLDQATVEQLYSCLQPASEVEGKLREDVELAMQGCGSCDSAGEDAQQLAMCLGQSWGYSDVRLRTALGGGEGQSCLRNLRHTFLTVNLTGRSYVVDLAFKEQFIIAKPTERYAVLLDCLPRILVTEEAVVEPLVRFLCKEMADAFQQQAAQLPPWRCVDSMLSKWLPRRSMDKPADALDSQPPAQPQLPLPCLNGPDRAHLLAEQQQLLRQQLDCMLAPAPAAAAAEAAKLVPRAPTASQQVLTLGCSAQATGSGASSLAWSDADAAAAVRAEHAAAAAHAHSGLPVGLMEQHGLQPLDTLRTGLLLPGPARGPLKNPLAGTYGARAHGVTALSELLPGGGGHLRRPQGSVLVPQPQRPLAAHAPDLGGVGVSTQPIKCEPQLVIVGGNFSSL